MIIFAKKIRFFSLIHQSQFTAVLSVLLPTLLLYFAIASVAWSATFVINSTADADSLPPASDISIDCDFSDWSNGAGTEFVVDDEGGENDWKKPSKLDITRFAVSPNTPDTFYVLIAFDDIVEQTMTAAYMMDTDLDRKINYAFVTTVNPSDSKLELYSCDDTLIYGCGNATLVKSYSSPGDFCVGSGTGPWNGDTFVEAVFPLSDIEISSIKIDFTSLVSYAAVAFLTSPKDSILGSDEQNYEGRIRCDRNERTCEIIETAGTPNVSGTVYADGGITPIGSGRTVRLLLNGVDAGSDITNQNGDYFISIGIPVSAGDGIVIFIDDDITYKGTTVTVFDGVQIVDLDIYTDHVVTRHDNGGILTNSNMSGAKSGYSDADILYSVSGGALTVNGSKTELYVPSGSSFAPGGNITTPNMESFGIFAGGNGAIDINGILVLSGGSFTATSGNMSVAGNFVNSGGTFSHNNGTVTLNGTDQMISGSSTFYDLSKTTAADTLTFEAGSTQAIEGTVTLQGGAGNLLTLQSSSAGNHWSFSLASGAVKDVSYVTVQDSDASGSDAGQKPINPGNSIDNGNNVDWFSLLPDILIVKSVQTFTDPYNGLSAPKAIPGAVMLYTIMVTNQGMGATDADTIVIIDPVPVNGSLFVGDINGPGSGPLQFADGATPSGLTYIFSGLDSLTDDVAFSNDNGTSFSYIPVPVDGFDTNVTHIRVNPKGPFNGASGAATPGFEIRFKVRVE